MDGVSPDVGAMAPGLQTEKLRLPNGKGGSPALKGVDLGALEKACEDFESILIYTLLKTMQVNVLGPGGGAQKDVYTTLGNLEVARSIAHGRGIGLKDLLFEELKRGVSAPGI